MVQASRPANVAGFCSVSPTGVEPHALASADRVPTEIGTDAPVRLQRRTAPQGAARGRGGPDPALVPAVCAPKLGPRAQCLLSWFDAKPM